MTTKNPSELAKSCLERFDRALSASHYADAVSALDDYYQCRLSGSDEPFGAQLKNSAMLGGDRAASMMSILLADRLLPHTP